MTSSVSLVFLRPWSVQVWGDQITGLKDNSQPKLQVIGRFLGLGPEGNQTKKTCPILRRPPRKSVQVKVGMVSGAQAA